MEDEDFCRARLHSPPGNGYGAARTDQVEIQDGCKGLLGRQSSSLAAVTCRLPDEKPAIPTRRPGAGRRIPLVGSAPVRGPRDTWYGSVHTARAVESPAQVCQ